MRMKMKLTGQVTCTRPGSWLVAEPGLVSIQASGCNICKKKKKPSNILPHTKTEEGDKCNRTVQEAEDWQVPIELGPSATGELGRTHWNKQWVLINLSTRSVPGFSSSFEPAKCRTHGTSQPLLTLPSSSGIRSRFLLWKGSLAL